MKNPFATSASSLVLAANGPSAGCALFGPPTPGHVVVAEDERLEVRCVDDRQVRCEVLEAAVPLRLAPGDRVLLLPPASPDGLGVVLGRLRSYRPQQVQPQLTIEASESLSLRCGESTVALRADGRLMIRGDDVLVRAKGTQRIRAGTVSIN
jgi:hypothetical protein